MYYNSLVKDDVYYADIKVYSAAYYQLHKDDIRARQHKRISQNILHKNLVTELENSNLNHKHKYVKELNKLYMRLPKFLKPIVKHRHNKYLLDEIDFLIKFDLPYSKIFSL